MKFCCNDMAYHVDQACGIHDKWECADVVIVTTASGFGLPIHDGGSSYIEIRHCPWCGRKLS